MSARSTSLTQVLMVALQMVESMRQQHGPWNLPESTTPAICAKVLPGLYPLLKAAPSNSVSSVFVCTIVVTL